MDQFVKFAQFTKVQETGDGNVLVWGIATLEQPDLDNEVCDYDTAKDAYQTWSDAAKARTEGAGQEVSLGNVRYQHTIEPAGKATKIDYKDDEKEIWLGSVPISDDIRKELQQGFLTGYSQGGSYAWRKCTECGKSLTLQQANNFCPACKKQVQVLFGLKRVAEVSYVDSPCTGVGFDYVKADGSKQFVKFAKRGERVELSQEQIDQIVAEVKKKTPKHVAGEGRAKFIAAVEKRAAEAGLEKGLWQVGRLAEVLQTLAFLYEDSVIEREFEGDDSEVPEGLKDALERLIEIFIASATEEAKELAAKKADINKGGSTMTPEEKDALEKAAKKSLAAHFAKSAVHHEKMAKAHHEAAASHEDMCEAAKASKATKADESVEEPKANVASADYFKAAAAHHGVQKAAHEKMAKAHESHAEHLSKMAESHDKEEAEKTIKAEREAVGAQVTKTDAPDDFMAAAVKKAQADLLADPAFMAKVKEAQEASLLGGIVDKTVADELQKRREATLAPDGVKLADATGLRIAQRSTGDAFKFADSTSVPSTAGL
jgi:hypothetical protein